MSFRVLKARPRLGTILLFGGGAAGGWVYRGYAHGGSHHIGLDPVEFSKYELTGKKIVSSTCSIFTLRSTLPASSVSAELSSPLDARQLWSVQLKQPELQIGRSYTPLPAEILEPDLQNDRWDRELQLLIRREAGGEVSGYLHRLPLQSQIEVRGPHTEYEVPPFSKQILFLAGGTGIAPALQAAAIVAKDPDAKIMILWGNRSRDDCVGMPSPASNRAQSSWRSWLGLSAASASQAKVRLDGNLAGESKHPIVSAVNTLVERSDGRVRVQCFVDEEQVFIQPSHVTEALKNLRSTSVDAKPRGQILISGPDGFVDYWAGRKQWESQGALGGVLGRMSLEGWSVWKM